MSENSTVQPETTPASHWVGSTHWSAVLAAGQAGSPQAAAAMEELCRTYWYAMYAYIRRRGYEVEEAQDLAQGFFAEMLENHWLKSADPKRGKFRSFLLGGDEPLPGQRLAPCAHPQARRQDPDFLGRHRREALRPGPSH